MASEEIDAPLFKTFSDNKIPEIDQASNNLALSLHSSLPAGLG